MTRLGIKKLISHHSSLNDCQVSNCSKKSKRRKSISECAQPAAAPLTAKLCSKPSIQTQFVLGKSKSSSIFSVKSASQTRYMPVKAQTHMNLPKFNQMSHNQPKVYRFPGGQSTPTCPVCGREDSSLGVDKNNAICGLCNSKIQEALNCFHQEQQTLQTDNQKQQQSLDSPPFSIIVLQDCNNNALIDQLTTALNRCCQPNSNQSEQQAAYCNRNLNDSQFLYNNELPNNVNSYQANPVQAAEYAAMPAVNCQDCGCYPTQWNNPPTEPANQPANQPGCGCNCCEACKKGWEAKDNLAMLIAEALELFLNNQRSVTKKEGEEKKGKPGKKDKKNKQKGKQGKAVAEFNDEDEEFILPGVDKRQPKAGNKSPKFGGRLKNPSKPQAVNQSDNKFGGKPKNPTVGQSRNQAGNQADKQRGNQAAGNKFSGKPKYPTVEQSKNQVGNQADKQACCCRGNRRYNQVGGKQYSNKFGGSSANFAPNRCRQAEQAAACNQFTGRGGVCKEGCLGSGSRLNAGYNAFRDSSNKNYAKYLDYNGGGDFAQGRRTGGQSLDNRFSLHGLQPIAHYRPGTVQFPASYIVKRNGEYMRRSLVRTAAGVTLHERALDEDQFAIGLRTNVTTLQQQSVNRLASRLQT